MKLEPSNQRFPKAKPTFFSWQCKIQDLYGKKFNDPEVFVLDRQLIQATEQTLTQTNQRGHWIPYKMEVFNGGVIFLYRQGPVSCFLETTLENGQLLWSLAISIKVKIFEKRGKKLNMKLRTLVSEKKAQDQDLIQFEWQDQTLNQALDIMSAFFYKENYSMGRTMAKRANAAML
jgi:hypothetical protein